MLLFAIIGIFILIGGIVMEIIYIQRKQENSTLQSGILIL